MDGESARTRVKESALTSQTFSCLTSCRNLISLIASRGIPSIASATPPILIFLMATCLRSQRNRMCGQRRKSSCCAG